MSNRLSQKSNRVKWVADANLCQVKLFLSEDCPSQVGCTAEDNLQAKASWTTYSNGVCSDDLPPGFGGKEQLETLKQPCIPQIGWKRPPRFILNSDWHVVAGELSQESGTQKRREMRVLEAFYPRVSAIPPSPTISADLEECDYDDHQTPLIPVTPIEEEDALDLGSPTGSKSAANDLGVVAVSSAHYNVPIESKPFVNGKSHGASIGLEADVAAAASAAFTAIMKSNEQAGMIDTDLLIKILSDPKMIEKLSKDTSTITKAIPVSELKSTSIATPLSTAESQLSVFQKLLENNSNMNNIVQKLQPALHNTLPTFHGIQTRNSVSSGQADGCSSSTFLPSVSEVATQSRPMPFPEPHALLSKKPEDVNQLLQALLSAPTTFPDMGSKMAIPSLTCSASEPEKFILRRPVDGDLEPSRMCPPTSSSQFLGSTAGPRSDLFTHSDRYPLQNPVSSDLGSQPSMKMVSSTGQANQSSFQSSSSQSPDRPPVTSLSMKTLPVKDTSYYRSLIKLHGMEGQETQELYLPQYNNLSASELTAGSGPGDSRLKKQKPCKYFNSSAGCKKGSSCPFQHDSLLKLRDGSSIHDAAAHSSKRVKLSRELTGGM